MSDIHTLVEILRTIALYCEGKEMRFLVCGGQAMNVYGISRQTGDLDLIVPRSRKQDWMVLMEKLKYLSFQDDERFSRFKPPELAAWPIDIMYVDDATFGKMHDAGVETDFGTAIARVVSVEHLVTLKIHALKYHQPHREPKDYGDLLALLQTRASGMSHETLERLCERYSDHALFERLMRDLNRKEPERV